MKLKTPVLIASVALIGLAACQQQPYGQGGFTSTNAGQGALAGAVLGAALGATSNASDRGAAAVAGAIAGGALGGGIGYSLDRQMQALRANTSGNIGIVNAGDHLIVTMPQDLLFSVDSASVRPDLQNDLRAVANNLQQFPQSRIEIIGHTDSTGDAGYNRQLSQRRAAAVASVLSASGVPGSRIATIGRGEDAPIASNLNEQGRAQNRRVEILIRPYN